MNSTQENDESDLSLKCLVTLSRAHHSVMHLVQKNIESFGLFPSEFAVLELLFHKGEQPIQQIGKRILLTSGSITYVIDKLESKELLQRKRCAKDRRVIYAAITERGQALMQDIFPEHQQAINNIFNELTFEEKQALTSLLKKLGLSLQQ